jgi:hypothetical protein
VAVLGDHLAHQLVAVGQVGQVGGVGEHLAAGGLDLVAGLEQLLLRRARRSRHRTGRGHACSAVARPMPEEPPVITTTLPCDRPRSCGR